MTLFTIFQRRFISVKDQLGNLGEELKKVRQTCAAGLRRRIDKKRIGLYDRVIDGDRKSGSGVFRIAGH